MLSTLKQVITQIKVVICLIPIPLIPSPNDHEVLSSSFTSFFDLKDLSQAYLIRENAVHFKGKCYLLIQKGLVLMKCLISQATSIDKYDTETVHLPPDPRYLTLKT